ncbi:unnamed protein product [Bathycoccus prasinos]
MKLTTEALVNGGSNYNCPKVAKFLVGALIFNRYPVKRQFQAGSLTGAVTSQKVMEVYKGSLRLDGNQP